MVNAATDLYLGAIGLIGDAIDLVIPIKSAATAAGLNPNAQDATSRILGGAAVAGSLFGAGAEGAAAKLTTAQAGDLAGWLGYGTRVKGAPFASRGQAVFSNGQNFITQDATMHLGPNATWKMFNNRGSRLGTFTYDLSTRLGK